MAEPMNLQSLGPSLRVTVMAAVIEAQRLGLSMVEAEHLLLALAADRRSPVGAMLEDQGLDHEAVLAALAAEREQALRSAGVEPRDPGTLISTRIDKRPRWGQSARRAMANAHRQSNADRRGRQRRRLVDFDLLGGILSLDFGTVPRALALAGFDREELRAMVAERVVDSSS